MVVNSPSPQPRPLWPKKVLLVVFAIIAFECALVGVSLKGRWFILLAPAAVCALKAVDLWREIRRDEMNSNQAG